MRLKGESNCLVFDNLSKMEVESYFERFGEAGWLDLENRILIEPALLNEFELSKYWTFLGTDISQVQFVIIKIDKNS